MKSYELKYGCNPHQKPAEIRMSPEAAACQPANAELPFSILNGNPGYINLMDALNSWQLVKELKTALNMPAAASFKHVSPTGAAIGLPLSDELKKAYFVEDIGLSPLAAAYARARGADRMSSFGDWAALSDTVDKPTALVLKKEVSDGVIAPGYSDEAFDILKQKKGGKFAIIRIDASYEAEDLERRSIFGIEFIQKRNTHIPGLNDLNNIITANRSLPDSAKRDMILAMITLKYTQSNSVCYVSNGQVIGCGAGQQSRIHCTRLAGEKADLWHLKQHPKVLSLRFKKDVGRPERDNAIDLFVRDSITEYEHALLNDLTEGTTTTGSQSGNSTGLSGHTPERLTSEEKKEWLKGLKDVTLGSDAFFPFRDNIDRAYMSGVKYIVQPGGSMREDLVVEACNQYGMVMCITGLRLFHH